MIDRRVCPAEATISMKGILEVVEHTFDTGLGSSFTLK